MKKLIYGALMVAMGFPLLQSCIDDKESLSVTEVREGQANKFNAEAEYMRAQAEAELIIANADAAIKYAEAQYQMALANLKAVEVENAKVSEEMAALELQLKQIEVAMQQVQLESELLKLESQKLELENQKLQLEVLQAQYAAEIANWNLQLQIYNEEMKKSAAQAEVDLQNLANDLLKATLENMQAQQALDDYEHDVEDAKNDHAFNDAQKENQYLQTLLGQFQTASANYMDQQAVLFGLQYDLANAQQKYNNDTIAAYKEINSLNETLTKSQAGLAYWSNMLSTLMPYYANGSETLEEVQDSIITAREEVIIALNEYNKKSEALVAAQSDYMNADYNLTHTTYYFDGVSKFMDYFSTLNSGSLTGSKVKVYETPDPATPNTYDRMWYVMENTENPTDSLLMFTYSYTVTTLEGDPNAIPEGITDPSRNIPAGELTNTTYPDFVTWDQVQNPNNWTAPSWKYATINNFYSYEEDGIDYLLANYNYVYAGEANKARLDTIAKLAKVDVGNIFLNQYKAAVDTLAQTYYAYAVEKVYNDTTEYSYSYKDEYEYLLNQATEASKNNAYLTQYTQDLLEAQANLDDAIKYLSSAKTVLSSWELKLNGDATATPPVVGDTAKLGSANRALAAAEEALSKLTSTDAGYQQALASVNAQKTAVALAEAAVAEDNAKIEQWTKLVEFAQNEVIRNKELVAQAQAKVDSVLNGGDENDVTAAEQAAWDAFFEYTGMDSFGDNENPGSEIPDADNPYAGINTPWAKVYGPYIAALGKVYGDFVLDEENPATESINASFGYLLESNLKNVLTGNFLQITDDTTSVTTWEDLIENVSGSLSYNATMGGLTLELINAINEATEAEDAYNAANSATQGDDLSDAYTVLQNNQSFVDSFVATYNSTFKAFSEAQSEAWPALLAYQAAQGVLQGWYDILATLQPYTEDGTMQPEAANQDLEDWIHQAQYFINLYTNETETPGIPYLQATIEWWENYIKNYELEDQREIEIGEETTNVNYENYIAWLNAQITNQTEVVAVYKSIMENAQNALNNYMKTMGQNTGSSTTDNSTPSDSGSNGGIKPLN